VAIGREEILRLRLERLLRIVPKQVSDSVWVVPCTECETSVTIRQAGVNSEGEAVFSRKDFCTACEELFCKTCRQDGVCWLCEADKMNEQGELCH